MHDFCINAIPVIYEFLNYLTNRHLQVTNIPNAFPFVGQIFVSSSILVFLCNCRRDEQKERKERKKRSKATTRENRDGLVKFRHCNSYVSQLMYVKCSSIKLFATFYDRLKHSMKNLKAHANGHNKSQHYCVLLGGFGQHCCVRLHGSKSLTGFKL